jgi:protein O-GlcNAc transferase
MQDAAAHMRAGRHAQAAACFEQLTELIPHDPTLWCHLGMLRTATGDLDGAAAALRRATALNPSYTDALACLGMLLATQQKAGEAEGVLARAVALAPGRSDLLYAYTRLLTESGRAAEAVSLLRAAIERSPEGGHDLLLHDKLCMMLNYVAGVDPRELFEAHRRFGRVAPPPRPLPAFDRSPDRPLRIGYVSPDLREHSVAYFLEPLLEHRDRAAFHITCYHAGAGDDHVTARLKALSDRWRSLVGVGDEAAYDQVVSDRIDLLIDLAGHTAGNRLALFALKPAPVQATYIGYPNTTGLTQIDGRFVDELTDPVSDVGCRMSDVKSTDGAQAIATETLVRLPTCFLCYRPSPDAPDPARHPTSNIPHPTSPIVFASFNSLAKLSPPTIALWSRLLHEVPGSRLMLKGKGLADPAVSSSFLARFAAHGIPAARLDLVSHTPSTREHLAHYQRADIALDPFPYAGTTTTCEALWMGLPVVSLVGHTHASRVGLSLLSAAGFPEWAAPTESAYLELAKSLAADPAQRARLRATLRPTLAASPLLNAPAFTGTYESALRTLWRSRTPS